jgi:hypothetical protein
MERSYGLVKDGKIFNVISATAEVIEEIGLEKLSADAVVDLSGTQFGIGCLYDYAGKVSRPERQPEPPKEPTLEERLAALEDKVQTIEEPLK